MTRRSIINAGIAVIALGAAIVLAGWHLNQRMKTVLGETRALASQVQALAARIDGLETVPLAWAETPTGLRRVPADVGVTLEELDFLQRFRGALLDLDLDLGAIAPDDLPGLLRDRIMQEFASDLRNLELGDTERSALITFAMLRVHGSIPTYAVRSTVPQDLGSLLLGTAGNCSDFSLRMMMVADALGLRVAHVSVHTPALLGHVFVDAHDPEEDRAYLLDANFNVLVRRDGAGGRGFLAKLVEQEGAPRQALVDSSEIVTFPVYFRFVDMGVQGLTRTPLSPDFINATRGNRREMWQTWLAEDIDALVDWWQRTPSHRPRTLSEWAELGYQIPAAFGFSGPHAADLRQAAGLDQG